MVLALLDALHQLQRGREAFLDVGADLAVGRVARQQAAIDGAKAQLRHVIVVHEYLPAIVHLAEIDVRLDQPRLRLVVAQAGARVETADDVHGALDELDRTIQGARDFLELIALQKTRERIVRARQLFIGRGQRTLGHALGNNLACQSVLRIESSQLCQQAFAQVARSHAQRIELLHHGQRFFHVLGVVISVLGDFFQRYGEITVFIQIADDDVGDRSHRFVAYGKTQLPGKMIRQSLGRRDERLEGRPLDNLALAAGLTAAAVQVLVEE